MAKYLLLVFSLLAAALSFLTVVRAPDWIVGWWGAILAGEFGHWLVLLPLGLAIAAVSATSGAWRGAILVLCMVAFGDFLRPAFTAWRMAEELPAELRTAFGDQTVKAYPFSWKRLYGRGRVAKAVMTTEVVGHPDGQDLKADVFRPLPNTGSVAKPRPCVVIVHGGGWDGGDRKQLPEWNNWLVSRGYVVAAISYRLAPKYPWPAQGDDVLTTIAWLKAHAAEFGIDPTRLVLFGRSAGGQIATAAGYGAHDPAIRGVISLYAPQDMPFVWSVSREDDVLNSLKLMRQLMGGPPEGARLALYESASGQLLARPDSPPTLLVHGVPDTLSWVRHSERLNTRLDELKVPHYFLRLPWATHAYDFNPDGPGGQLSGYAIEWFLASVTKSR